MTSFWLIWAGLIVGAWLIAVPVGEEERHLDRKHARNAAEWARLTAPLAPPVDDLSLGALPPIPPGRVGKLVTTSPGGAR